MATTFTNDFSREIFEQTYRMGSEDVNDAHRRVATYLASVEKDSEGYSKKFLELLGDFKFVPGGRISSNAGLGLKSTTLINCFVSAPGGEDIDSMVGIHRELGNQMAILKSEGGYGFCASFMRPRGAYVSGIANYSPGAIEMLNIWDASSATITAGSGMKQGGDGEKAKGKIRKGAQMVTMHVWHPDICEFIVAKQTPGRLTKFNMSVLITDAFVDAVKAGSPWNLEFPDYQLALEKYKKDWDGDLTVWKKTGGPVKIYKSYENAGELYNEIITATYNRNEPGVLFIDTANKMNNLWYCENFMATNPCSEQIMPPGGVCLLGSFNLAQFINSDYTDWDFPKLARFIPIAIRLMDNVNDLTGVPLEIQKWNMQNKRRIGLGIMGYGSALYMMKIRYGSQRALEMTNALMQFFANTTYNASVDLAIEKGAFPLFDAEKYPQSKFIQTLLPETQERIRKHGIRNSHLLSIQPTGNSSIYANNVSGGLEPIWMPTYVRTSMMPQVPEGMHPPKNVDWMSKKFQGDQTAWKWKKEGDESLLYTEFNGSIWKFDKARGLLRETEVVDYSVQNLRQRNEWDPTALWVATVPTLTIDEHIDTMKVFSKYIDSSMSKTVNVPANYPFRDFKKMYLTAYDTGTIKGITSYRDGTMSYVLSSVSTTTPSTNESPTEITPTKAPKRPKELPCDINVVKYKQIRYVVLVGLLNSVPYEVFAFKEKDISFKPSLKEGHLVKEDSGSYNLITTAFDITDIGKNFNSCEESLVARLISLSLKNGVSIDSVYHQLTKSGESIASFSRVIARTLSKYVKTVKESKCQSCESPNGLVFSEGCMKCGDCGWSKCG
jgi:ribonucleoside-diphosphate reductase alpha chain